MPPSDFARPDSKQFNRPGRGEWALVLFTVLLGLGFRGALSARMAVEHFDEGVYASNIWFGAEQDFRYPARHLYAPPLVPWLLESSQIVLGPSGWACLLPGVLAGTLTIFLLWWGVRRWFGSTAGLTAAVFAAFSDYHVIYSRTALTEPVLCLLLLLGVYFVWRAVSEADFRLGVIAGLATGLSWASKYNGWLPLMIGLAGLSAWSIRPGVPNPLRQRRFAVLGVTILSALFAFAPIWWGLQEFGGYRVVRENHARYLVGLSGWAAAAKRQLANHQFFDGPLSWLGLVLGVLSSRLSMRITQPTKESAAFRLRSLSWTFAVAAFLGALGMWIGTSVILGLLAVGGFVAACPWRRKLSNDPDEPNRPLAYWFAAAWFLGLLLATPLYTPYPRLSLPWLISAWIGAAALASSESIQKLIAGEHDWQTSSAATVPAVLGVVASTGLGTGISQNRHQIEATWEDRTGLQDAASDVHSLISRQFRGRAVVYVYAEPALFYHLRSQDIAAAPVADLQFTGVDSAVPILLAVGPHARRNPRFQEEWRARRRDFTLLENFSYRPSDLVLLNHYPPEKLNNPQFLREQTVRLYRWNPP